MTSLIFRPVRKALLDREVAQEDRPDRRVKKEIVACKGPRGQEGEKGVRGPRGPRGPAAN